MCWVCLGDGVVLGLVCCFGLLFWFLDGVLGFFVGGFGWFLC